MRAPFLGLLLGALAPLLPAQDVPLQAASELSPDLFITLPRVIHPGLTLYGVKWYASPETVATAFGPPHGKIVYDRDTFGLLYGQSHTLVFEKNELREVIIASTIFRETPRAPAPHPFFDGAGMTVEPGYWLLPMKADLDGLLGSMGFEFKRVLTQVMRGQTTFRYATKFAAVELDLLAFTDRRNGAPDELQIRQISIRGY